LAKGKGSGAGGFGKVLLGFVLGIIVVAVGVVAYLRWGAPPVATADKPFPFEKAIVSVPMAARIQSQIKQPPFGVSEDVYEGGAKVYREQCAACHGTPGKDVPFAKHMYPAAPQLWKKHARAGRDVLEGGERNPADGHAGI
jgi:mono/diheme cytochrome c family protein